MSLFKRASSRTTGKSDPSTEDVSGKDAPTAKDESKRSFDIAQMIREELDTQESAETKADVETTELDDVWENPFEEHDANMAAAEDESDIAGSADNVLPLSAKDAIPSKRPISTDEEVSIDDIRKNILRITEDWRLSSEATADIDDDDAEEPIVLATPLTLENGELEDGENEDEYVLEIDTELPPVDITSRQASDYSYGETAAEEEVFDVTELHPEEDGEIEAYTPSDEDTDVTDVTMDDEADNTPSLTAEGLNLGELRLDIARITSDIDNGEALYRRAQQRVTSLMGFMEKAEVAVSVLNRLQPENRKLIAKNRSLETDVEAQKYIIASLENDRTKLRDNLDQATNREETLRGQFTELKSILDERNRENEALLTDADATQMQLERIKTNLEIATRENSTLNDRMSDLSEHIQRLSEEKINTEKTLETVKADLNDELDRNNSMEAENSELRISLRTSNRHNSEMHNELMEVQDKIVIYKTQHETHLHRRDDRIIVLESRIKELEKIIKHKDEIVQTKTDNVSALKKSVSRHEIEREKLEKIVEDQNYQLSKAEEELLSSKHDIAELDQQYRDLAKALSRRPAATQVERKRKIKANQAASAAETRNDDDEDPTPLKVSA